MAGVWMLRLNGEVDEASHWGNGHAKKKKGLPAEACNPLI